MVLERKLISQNFHVKFNESLVILDEILKCQRLSFDKYGLGFKKEEDKLKEVLLYPRTPEAGPSMTKDEYDAPAHGYKEVENSKVPHEATPTHQSHSFERRITPRWIQTSRYENRFNGYCFSCSNFGHKAME